MRQVGQIEKQLYWFHPDGWFVYHRDLSQYVSGCTYIHVKLIIFHLIFFSVTQLCCSFGQLDNISCGPNVKAGFNKIIPLSSCTNSIQSHCRNYHINYNDINKEEDLLRYRGGLFNTPTAQCTICPNHRYKLGLGWKPSNNCSLNYCLSEASRKRRKPLSKGTVSAWQSHQFWIKKNVFVQIGSGNLS